MKTGFRFSLMTAMILLVLIFSAVVTVPAYADDGAPPPADPPAEGIPPVDESTPPVESVDPAPVVEEPAQLTELIGQLPDGTDVVVLNEAGASLPLASEEAAQVVATIDPMWCPAGAAPGAASCSKSYTSLQNLVTDFMGDGLLDNAALTGTFSPTGNGVIWIQSGTDASTSPILIDGVNAGFVNVVNFGLTLQGGWTGTPGSTALNATTPYSTFTVPLWIQGWAGAVTLKNITINDSVAPVTVGYDSSALYVNISGNITLDTVNVQNNSDAVNTLSGAYLNNTSSSAGATVTIKNSSFDENEGTGLLVSSDGIVTINNITANGNHGTGGASINNTTGADKGVTITGVQQFNNNDGGYGLVIQSKGAISLGNIAANNNAIWGVWLNNTSSAGSLSVNIKGINQFNNNGSYGLSVQSHGVITANSITAIKNGQIGATFDNYNGTSLPKAVTLTGTNIFNGNGITAPGYGLTIQSLGAITVSNITASGNNTGGDDNGVVLNNNFSGAIGGVTINGYGIFEHNAMHGLQVASTGIILLNNINANQNGYNGAKLDNMGASFPKAVTLNGINTFNGNGTGFAGYGLEVNSLGAITVNNITASGNNTGGNDGGVFLNNYWMGAIGGVTINGYGTFEHNAVYGLKIFSGGAILLNNINANQNSYGAIIDNCDANFQTNHYDMICAYSGKSITLKGVNNFNGNTGYGLEALSGGAILAGNLTANGNGSADSWYKLTDLDAPRVGNALLDSKLAITLTGINTFNNNTTYEGVTIYSSKAVTVSSLSASGNFGRGAYISGIGTTTLTGFNNFNNNLGGNGLTIDNNWGTVTLSNVTANGNSSNGAYIRNDYLPATPWNVTLLGISQFNGNGASGLGILSHGAVLLNNITANYNTSGDGMFVNNYAGSTLPKPITLNGFNNFNNNLVGTEIVSIGIITFNNITANSNGALGAHIQNDFLAASALSPGVFINGNNSFSNNTTTGLEIFSNGAITLNNINANNNLTYGANLDNHLGVLKAVTLTGVNNFNSNTNHGLYITSNGVVTLTHITANNNGFSGMFVTTHQNIMLTCGSTYNNGGYGIQLDSTSGSVTVKGMYSFSNGVGNKSISNFLPSPAVVYPCALP